jgi:hypothetical protein
VVGRDCALHHEGDDRHQRHHPPNREPRVGDWHGRVLDEGRRRLRKPKGAGSHSRNDERSSPMVSPFLWPGTRPAGPKGIGSRPGWPRSLSDTFHRAECLSRL